MFQNETRRDLHALNARLMTQESRENKGSGKGGKPFCEQIWTSKMIPHVLTIELATKAETFREWSLTVKDFFEMHMLGVADYLKTMEIVTEPITL